MSDMGILDYLENEVKEKFKNIAKYCEELYESLLTLSKLLITGVSGVLWYLMSQKDLNDPARWGLIFLAFGLTLTCIYIVVWGMRPLYYHFGADVKILSNKFQEYGGCLSADAQTSSAQALFRVRHNQILSLEEDLKKMDNTFRELAKARRCAYILATFTVVVAGVTWLWLTYFP